MHTILHSTTPINWDFLNTFWRANTLHMSKNDNFVCAPRLLTTYAWVPFFACMFRLNDRKLRSKNMLTSDGRADRHNKRFYPENEKLFEINETVLANSNDIVFYWKAVFFWHNVFLASPNFGGHRLIVSCKKSSSFELHIIYWRLRWIKLYQFNIGWDTPSPIQFLILFPSR